MKTTTLLLLAVAFYVYSTSQKPTSSTSNTPATPPTQPQSGGGSTFNDVMNLITASVTAIGSGINYATSRTSTQSSSTSSSGVASV